MSFTQVSKNLTKILSVMLIAVCLFIGCEEKKLPAHNDTQNGSKENISFTETQEQTDFVKMEMMDGGIVIIELYPDIAPITVENFKKLVGKGFYNGLLFHRVIADFVIQTGDPTATGRGGSKETIKGEFGINGFSNNLSHTAGVLSMARSSYDLDSASSQFFICHGDCSRSLDGKYAAFGKVIAGMDVVNKIATVMTDAYDKPVEDQQISSIKFVKIEK